MTSALLRAERDVYLPFFNAHGRVDLVYRSSGGGFRRVQCKSARVVNDVMVFAACSHTGGVERSYVGDVDEFGVYCHENGNVYLVPIADVPTRVAYLRLKQAQNNQERRVRWASAYLLGPAW